MAAADACDQITAGAVTSTPAVASASSRRTESRFIGSSPPSRVRCGLCRKGAGRFDDDLRHHAAVAGTATVLQVGVLAVVEQVFARSGCDEDRVAALAGSDFDHG